MTRESSISEGGASVVVLSGPGLEFCLPVENVREIVRSHEWQGDPPVDIAALWGSPLDDDEESSRLLVVEARGRSCALKTATVSYRNIKRADVQPLPPFLGGRWATRGIVGIVFGESQAPLIVLGANALLDLVASAEPHRA